MSNTINLPDEGSYEHIEGNFLINHVTMVRAINVVNAQYASVTTVHTGQVAIPTSMDTGRYIALDDEFDPVRDLSSLNEKNMTFGQILSSSIQPIFTH